MKNDVQQLQQEIQKWDGNLGRLREALRTSQERVAKLEAERKPCALAMRIEKDPKAQERLRQLDAEIEILSRDIRDDNDAISHALQTLEQLRADLAVAEEESRREGARLLIRARLKAGPERRIAELVRELKAEVEAILASDQEIATALRSLHPTPASEVRVTNGLRSRDLIWNFLGFTLGDPLLPTGNGYRSHHLRVPAAEDAEQLVISPPAFFNQLLADIDALPALADDAEPSVTAAD